MLVEFIGLPGSGKTRLLREVSEVLQSNGVEPRHADATFEGLGPVADAVARASLALRFCRTSPALARRCTTAVLRTRQQKLRDLWTVNANLLCRSELMRQMRSESGIVLSDEGVLHALWSTLYRAGHRSAIGPEIRPLLDALTPARWVVIHVRADPDAAIRRLRLRAGHVNRFARDLRTNPSSAVVAARDSLAAVIDQLDHFRALDAGSRIHFFEVDSTLDEALATNVQRCCDLIGDLRSAPVSRALRPG